MTKQQIYNSISNFLVRNPDLGEQIARQMGFDNGHIQWRELTTEQAEQVYNKILDAAHVPAAELVEALPE